MSERDENLKEINKRINNRCDEPTIVMLCDDCGCEVGGTCCENIVSVKLCGPCYRKRRGIK